MDDRGPFAHQLRYWRRLRRFSQLALAGRAATTTRHLSFLESGRSRPGEEMVLRLCEALDIPIRDRNELLSAAGLPPAYPERQLDDEDMRPFLDAIDYTLRAHDPYPAMAVTRWFDIRGKNRAASSLLEALPDTSNVVEALLQDAVGGVMENWHLLVWMMHRALRREAELGPPDVRGEQIVALVDEAVRESGEAPTVPRDELMICPRFRIGGTSMSFGVMAARFGTARETTLADLQLLLAFPRDKAAKAWLEQSC